MAKVLPAAASPPTLWDLPKAPGGRADMKKDLHPEYYPEAKVFFKGEQVMTVGATVPEMTVEIWSGSHPFYTGTSSFVDTAGRVEKFQKKFGGDYFGKRGGGKGKDAPSKPDS